MQRTTKSGTTRTTTTTARAIVLGVAGAFLATMMPSATHAAPFETDAAHAALKDSDARVDALQRTHDSLNADVDRAMSDLTDVLAAVGPRPNGEVEYALCLALLHAYELEATRQDARPVFHDLWDRFDSIARYATEARETKLAYDARASADEVKVLVVSNDTTGRAIQSMIDAAGAAIVALYDAETDGDQ